MTIQQFSAGQTLTAAQMNTLQESDFNYTVNTQSGTSYTLVASDLGKLVRFTNAGSVTLTVPTDASVTYSVGDTIVLMLDSTGTLTVAGAVGVTINSEGGILTLNSRYSMANLVKMAANSWVLTGVMMNTITDGEVTESKIAAGAVTSAKLASDSVTTAKILDSNVTTAKVADSAITSAKIADGTIVNADVSAAAAIDLGKIADATINTQSTNYPLVLTDKNKFIKMDSASNRTIGVPLHSTVDFPTGSQIHLIRYGIGTLEVIGESGAVNIYATPGKFLRAQYSSATLLKCDTNTWLLMGDLSTS